MRTRQSFFTGLFFSLTWATLCFSCKYIPEVQSDFPVQPGLREQDGSPHPLHEPQRAVGKTVNIVDFNADPSDNDKDDLGAIRAAILSAVPGDEVYFPAGVYNLKS